MNNRRTRRFKERRPMFPFGQLMLPVIGVVAIGLLVIGIKLFFFTGPGTPVIVAIPGNTTENAIPASPASPQEQVKPSENGTSTPQLIVPATKAEPVQTTRPKPVLAVPVTQEFQAAPRIVPLQEKTTGTNVVKKSSDPLSPHQSGKKPEAREQGSKKSGWGVQVGAFSAKNSADSLLSKVIKQGFDGEVNQAQVNGKLFYRVRVPSGNSRESAMAMAQKLKDKGYPTLVVTLGE